MLVDVNVTGVVSDQLIIASIHLKQSNAGAGTTTCT